jgi:predicted ester cyclase
MMTHTDTSRIEANRALGRRFFEEQDRLQGGPAPELCAADYTAVLGGNPPMNRDGHEGFARAFYSAFPGIRHSIEEVIASEDGVAVRFILHGVHAGSFFAIPPTQKRVTIAANVIMRIEAGKVKRLFGIFDEAGLLRQLGVLQ